MNTIRKDGPPPTPTRLRPIAAGDHELVLALNEDEVDLLAPMDVARLQELTGLADRAAVIEHSGEFAGFVLTFGPGSAYDSANYCWFASRYDDFYYLDRIVLLPGMRRRGISTTVYAELERRARRHGRMALEVNVQPPNVASLAFHSGRGYREVGRQAAGDHEVALLVKELDG